MKRSYLVLLEIGVSHTTHSDIAYEEIAQVEASSPQYAAREGLRYHGEWIDPPMREVVVIPANAIKVVKVR